MFRRWISTGFAAAFFTSAVIAQTPTPEQLEIFRNLSPEQRQIVEQQLGLPSSTGRDNNSPEQRDQQQQSDLQRPVVDEETRQELLDSQRRVLRAEDSIIIEIDFELPPLPVEGAPASPATQQLPAASAMPQNEPLQVVEPEVIGRTPSGRSVRTLAPADIERLIRLRDLIRAHNPYRLTRRDSAGRADRGAGHAAALGRRRVARPRRARAAPAAAAHGRRGAQALRLRPVREAGIDVRARHGHPGAL
jgi:hypothetical protein